MEAPDIIDELRGFTAGSESARASLMRDAADEIARLRAWKAEALTVLAEWEETWEAAGRPGRLGGSKAIAVRDEIDRLRGALIRILGYTRGAVRRLMPEELAELERERRSDD